MVKPTSSFLMTDVLSHRSEDRRGRPRSCAARSCCAAGSRPAPSAGVIDTLSPGLAGLLPGALSCLRPCCPGPCLGPCLPLGRCCALGGPCLGPQQVVPRRYMTTRRRAVMRAWMTDSFWRGCPGHVVQYGMQHGSERRLLGRLLGPATMNIACLLVGVMLSEGLVWGLACRQCSLHCSLHMVGDNYKLGAPIADEREHGHDDRHDVRAERSICAARLRCLPALRPRRLRQSDQNGCASSSSPVQISYSTALLSAQPLSASGARPQRLPRALSSQAADGTHPRYQGARARHAGEARGCCSSTAMEFDMKQRDTSPSVNTASGTASFPTS